MARIPADSTLPASRLITLSYAAANGGWPSSRRCTTGFAAELFAIDREIAKARLTTVWILRRERVGTLKEVLAKALAGKTMTIPEAMAAARAAGYSTGGANFAVQVATALIRGPFTRVGRGRYAAITDSSER